MLEVSSSSHQTLNALVTKGVFSIEEKEISRIEVYDKEDLISFDLSDEQQNALNQIQKSFESKEVVLLHGVTSSGKTEIFIKLIQDVIARGQTGTLFVARNSIDYTNYKSFTKTFWR